jgi:TolA-binding protein
VNWLFVVLAIAVLALVFLVVLGPLGELPPAEPDRRPDTRDGEPSFDVVVRGYRMDEVDQQIAELQGQIAELQGHTELQGQADAVAQDAPIEVEGDSSLDSERGTSLDSERDTST